MTKTLKWLGGGIAAAMLLGLAGLFSGEVAEAQPAGSPHAFEGTVTLDGEGAAAGTSVTAIVGGEECGSATVLTNASGSVYLLHVPASCAEVGDTVSFKIGGYAAAETGTWNGTYSEVNLTASTGMTDDGMEECPEDDMGGMNGDDTGDDAPPEPDINGDAGMNGDDDMNGDMDCPDDGDDTGMGGDDDDDTGMGGDDDDDDMNGGMGEDPGAGKTGTGFATDSTGTSLAAILGMMALAIALGGYTYARRRS